jgi:hypothetical protein
MIYVLIAILQLTQSIFKVFDIKWSYENQTTKLMFLNFLMSGAWILSTGIGVGAVINGDLLMVSVYIIFGGLGKVVAIKVFHQNKYRNTIYNKIKGRDSP